MALSINDIARVALQWFIDGTDQVVNTHTLKLLSTVGTPTDLELMLDLATVIFPDLYADVLTWMNDNLVGTLLSGLNLGHPSTLPPVTLVGMDGINDNVSLTRQVTGLVCLNTDQPHIQGRSYLPPFADDATDDTGLWVGDALAALSGYGLLLLDPLVGDVGTWQRVVTDLGGNYGETPVSATVPLAPRTQRRRTPGRGA